MARAPSDGNPTAVTAARDALLSALDPSGRAWEARLERDWAELPWSWMLEHARHHKIAGAFAERLRSSGVLDRLPAAVGEAVSEERRLALRQSERAARTLALVDEIARELASPFFVIKGSLLAQKVWAPALRAFGDVDIVVPRERVDDWDRALRARKYYFWASPQVHEDLPKWFLHAAPPGEERGSKAEARRAMACFHRHYLYVLAEGDPRLPVEVHWHIFVPRESKASESEVWAHAIEQELCGLPVQALDREATLLHCAVHALEGGWKKHRLLHLADVVWILERWGGEIDSAKLAELGRRWGVGGALTAALEGARAVFPFPLPEPVERVWPKRSLWARRSLRSAGLGPEIVDLYARPRSWGRGVGEIWSDALWEMAWGRPPRTAWNRVRRLVATRVLRRRRVQSGSAAHESS